MDPIWIRSLLIRLKNPRRIFWIIHPRCPRLMWQETVGGEENKVTRPLSLTRHRGWMWHWMLYLRNSFYWFWRLPVWYRCVLCWSDNIVIHVVSGPGIYWYSDHFIFTLIHSSLPAERLCFSPLCIGFMVGWLVGWFTCYRIPRNLDVKWVSSQNRPPYFFVWYAF